jgi:transposase
MTNTHFEGLCEKNPKARHGKNKQKRDDCRQVAIGMAFDSRGLALAHDVFEGNIAETKTLAHMLDRLALPCTQAAKPVVILDAGFAPKQNIALLKERGLGYVINITRSSCSRPRKASPASKAPRACVPTSTNSNTASKPTSLSVCSPTTC